MLGKAAKQIGKEVLELNRINSWKRKLFIV